MTFDGQATVNSGRFLSALVLEELSRHGLGLVVACPGGRNQPLLGALAARTDLDVVRVVDERAAGHLALGWLRARAAAGAEPAMAAVITTSGSAPLLLAPALAEAEHTGLPLIAITADRPAELHGVGTNQTLDQCTPLAPFARAQRHLQCHADGTTATALLDATAAVAAAALGPPCGPAHLNLAFREPLVPDPEPLPAGWEASVAGWLADGTPWATRPTAPRPDTIPLDLRHDLATSRRPLLWLAGLIGARQRQDAATAAAALGIPTITDVGSGARFQPEVPLRLRHAEFYRQELAPCDLILQVGHQPVSLPLIQALAHVPRRWVLCDHPTRQDPGLQGGQQLDLPATLLTSLPCEVDPQWREHLLGLDRAWHQRLHHHVDEAGVFNEALVTRQLLRQLPADHGLYLSNSLSVRVADTVAADGAATILTNRGTSGIEGQIAQAVGAARGLDRPTVALLGDVTCQHDLGSLALVKEHGLPLLILVLQNQGGAIFRRLAARRHPELLDPWLTTHHEVDLCAVATAHGLFSRRLEHPGSLTNALTDFLRRPEPTLLEAVVPPEGHGDLLARLEEAAS